MADYPHLKLPFKVAGAHKSTGGGNNKKGGTTLENEKNRKGHGNYLQGQTNKLLQRWEEIRTLRKEAGLETPNEVDIPVFLKIDTDSFKFESLANWGINVLSEEEDGYIIGASSDNFEQFQKNINEFLAAKGTYRDTAAKIWEVITDDSWRWAQLIKGDLKEVWDNLDDSQLYLIELGVSCYSPNLKKYPQEQDFDDAKKHAVKLSEYHQHIENLAIERDEMQMKRENEIEHYAKIYGAKIEQIWDNQIDAIYFKMLINGQGLRDIVITYPFLYEVKLDSSFKVEDDNPGDFSEYQLDLQAPDENAGRVCVIDSGIQEGHLLLAPAIDGFSSKSYVTGDNSVGDHVKLSGHGTKVAGKILYPNVIPQNGPYMLQSIIQNARILDKHNRISNEQFGPKLMEQIVKDFPDTKIFNLSVSQDEAYNGTHMSSLAGSIDKLMHEKDVLFVIASGNLDSDCDEARRLGVLQHIASGKDFPEYLTDPLCRVANPGISFFALTVGSISEVSYQDDDYESIAGHKMVSPFSRSGPGLWGSIKPDLVEYGGDLVRGRYSSVIRKHEATAVQTVNSTLHGAGAVGRDAIGTSFSAPKVSYIASRLQAEHPNESAQMYRTLVVQSARLPEHCFQNPSPNDFKYYGYGIPDISRTLNNSPQRITYIQYGTVLPKKADIYHLNIPDELKGEGRDYEILVEVTLSFTSRTRLTRKGAHSYLATWLEWRSSRYNENMSSFRTRTIEYLDQDDEDGLLPEEGVGAIKWCLRENPAWGGNDINRNNSTVQKSWAIIKPHQFANNFSIAVVGHSGWDKDLEAETDYALAISFEAIGAEVPLYKLISEAQVEIEQET